ncbi:MAG: ABC transporter substrate-binding protein [Acetobacteraceae bacterium]
MQPKPMMLEGDVVSADGLTHTMTLRQGLRFHDGGPVTTRDVTASLNRWANNTSMGKQLTQRLAGMQAADDRTFTLTLKQPFGLLAFMLAGPGAPMAAIMREADANKPIDAPMTAPIGSGPFRFVPAERIAGQRAVFTRNPDYQARPEPPDGLAGGRVVKVDRVEWNILPDPSTAANALVTGEVDFWDTVPADLISYLRQRGVTVRRTNTLPSGAFIRPNFQVPPFNDVRARQALALLFDQRQFMEAVAGTDGAWHQCFSFGMCGSSNGSEAGSADYRKPNVERAKQLLAEAGYRGEPIVIASSPQLPIIEALAQVAAQTLRDAGMKVDLQEGDWAVVFKRVSTPNATGANVWNIFCSYSLGGTLFSPLTNTLLDLSCPATGALPTNFAGFPCDPAGEALRQKVFAAPDDATRQAAFEQFQTAMWTFIPYIPAGTFDVDNAYRKNISGVLDSYLIAYWNVEKH